MTLVGLLGITVAGIVLDLFSLLLLPFRIGGHGTPVAALLVFGVNALLGWIGLRLLRSRRPAQLLLAIAIALSLVGAGRGPGGDLFVTRDLQGLYLLYVIGAALGASAPLFVRASPRAATGRDTSRGDGAGTP